MISRCGGPGLTKFVLFAGGLAGYPGLRRGMTKRGGAGSLHRWSFALPFSSRHCPAYWSGQRSARGQAVPGQSRLPAGRISRTSPEPSAAPKKDWAPKGAENPFGALGLGQWVWETRCLATARPDVGVPGDGWAPAPEPRAWDSGLAETSGVFLSWLDGSGDGGRRPRSLGLGQWAAEKSGYLILVSSSSISSAVRMILVLAE